MAAVGTTNRHRWALSTTLNADGDEADTEAEIMVGAWVQV